MKVLVTGANGQLGWDVIRELEARGIECKGVDREDFDLLDAPAVKEAVIAYRPDAVVHCAAYTAVDRAESEPELCAGINGDGTLNVVRAALSVDAKLVYISTDYVFSGEGAEPWTEDSPYGPKNVYGLSKAQGEIAVRSLMEHYFILRTSWVFGVHGNNFVRTMMRLGRERTEVRVVDDQIGSPTSTEDLARVICDMLPTEKYGIYHVCNKGYISWAQFADMIMKHAGLRCRVTPIPTSEYPTPAHRPKNSRMDTGKLESQFGPMPEVEDALERCMRAMMLDEMHA
ncbi:MAG: dTDP-4-dehydrorhamnose reductase [Clostridia bacterium]|nr:dTDP-4-dehydrorhamnose reductase [Clostridia bacterium]